MTPDYKKFKLLLYTSMGAVVVTGLYFCSFYSYLLFHTLIEFITISIAFALFILTWNTRKYMASNYLKLLGIGYGFIAVIDLIHTFAYKGMNIFPGYGANLPTQLWIAARYFQAVTLIISPLFMDRKVNNHIVFTGYIIMVLTILTIIFSGNFPVCFIDGKGQTPFKINSEYVITILLFVSFFLLYKKRKHFSNRIFILIVASIACTAVSEMSFTAYISVYGFANMVGHFAKLFAFSLIYQAILVTGLREPFDLIFRDLKQAKDALNRTNETLEKKVIERTAALERSLAERKQAELLLREKSDEIEAQNEKYLQINEELQQTNNKLQLAKSHAEDSDRIKTAFLQNMSHEIRTPMNAIMGFSNLLVQNYNNKPKLEKFSEIINLRCNDLLEIINDILDISKIESGQLQVSSEECSLNELFAELTTFFSEHQKRIGKQHIAFSLQAFCNSVDSNIVTDKVKLRQIFINLIGNAFKFTETGKIEGGCKFDANHHLIFYVSDTGIGIPPDKHDEIFERFAQLRHEKKLVYGGTGLGLSIVKGLVELLGGKIWLESEPEKGTTFYFSFPYKLVPLAHREHIAMIGNQEYHFHGKTILVVEDDPYNAEYIKEILSDTGVSIKDAINGFEAVQLATSQSPDIVLMDIRLPDISGYEATRQIIQFNPAAKIIAQTAYAAHDDKQKAFDAGCIDYISKPLKKDLLLAMINKNLLKR